MQQLSTNAYLFRIRSGGAAARPSATTKTRGRSASGRARLLPSPIGLVAEFEVRLPGSEGASHWPAQNRPASKEIAMWSLEHFVPSLASRRDQGD